MCEFIVIRPYVFPNHPGPIDPILRPPDDSKHNLGPVYDLVAFIVYNCVGRVRCFSGEG